MVGCVEVEVEQVAGRGGEVVGRELKAVLPDFDVVRLRRGDAGCGGRAGGGVVGADEEEGGCCGEEGGAHCGGVVGVAMSWFSGFVVV